MIEQKEIKRQRFQGVVVGVGAKTAKVTVGRTVTHKKYGKRYSRRRTFSVHDEAGVAKVGERVTCEASQPYSKTKRWKIV